MSRPRDRWQEPDVIVGRVAGRASQNRLTLGWGLGTSGPPWSDQRRRLSLPVSARLIVWALALPVVLSACGGGPSEEEVQRSMNEFRLAATYRDEGDVPGALQHLRRALDLDPDNARAHILLGYVQLERKAFAEAETAVRKGIELLLEGESMEGTLSEARNVLGVVLIHRERYDDAVQELRAAANDELNRTPWYAWGNLGWALFEKGSFEDSVTALERSVEIQPRFCLGHYLLGQSYFALERYEEAETSLTRALEADERCGMVFQDAYKLRGETRARNEQPGDAIGDFERCVELGADTEAGRSCQRFLETVQ